MQPKILLLNTQEAESVDRWATFTAKITQRPLGPMDANKVYELWCKPVNKELVHKLIESGHSQCFQMNMVPVVVVGASRRFIAQITRHRVGVSFMATSLQYCAWTDPTFYGDEDPKLYDMYMTQLGIYRDMLAKYGTDQAGYLIPEGVQGTIIISATPWEWRHIIQVRSCNRNTPETREIIEMIAKELSKYSEVFQTGPPCTFDKCREANPCRKTK